MHTYTPGALVARVGYLGHSRCTHFFVSLSRLRAILASQHSLAIIYRAVPVIVCRFILNLRQIDYSGDSIISGDQTFSLRFVGSLGEPLQTSTDDELADEGYDEHVAQGMRPRRTDTATVEAGKEGLAGHTDSAAL